MRKRPRPIRPSVPIAPVAMAVRGGWIDAARFVSRAQPLLARNDAAALYDLLTTRYGRRDLCALLTDASADARKVAALGLAMVGHADCVPALAARLRDADPMVAQMAEHALWSIWCRAGSDAGNAHLMQGIEALDDRRLPEAVEEFSRSIAACPTFAEAYNQRAIAYFLLEDPCASLADCRAAVRLVPTHFGAWAGMGHCHAQRGEVAEALACYRRAMAIHPTLASVAEMVCELERCCGAGCRASRPLPEEEDPS